MANKSIIEVKNAGHTYISGQETLVALQKTTFSIDQKSFSIIYGPSGSGKSTLLNILSGLQKPIEGAVNYEGINIYDLAHDDLAHFRASKIGIVYQNNYWVKSLNCVENVAMPLYFLGFTKSKSKIMAMESLEKVEMQKYANKLPILLSGGEQQRIAMARALVYSPPVIIADEPTGSLDSKNGMKIMGILRKCQAESGQTIILVTHNMEYLPLADKLLHLEDGYVSVMDSHSIKRTTNQLMQDMQDRIDNLMKTKI